MAQRASPTGGPPLSSSIARPPSVPGMKKAPRPGHLCSAVILYNHSKTRRSPALRRRPGRRDKLACFLRPAHQDVLLHQPPALSGYGPGGCHGLAELIAAAHREAAVMPPARRAGRTTARGFSPFDGRQKKGRRPGRLPFCRMISIISAPWQTCCPPALPLQFWQ